MSDPITERFEIKVQALAATFVYPPTPGIAAMVRRRLSRPEPPRARRRGVALALAAAVFIVALLAVPDVRAGLIEILRLGAVRIFLVPPTETPTPTPPPITPGVTPSPTPTPRPTATPLASVLDLAGETTFDDAQSRFGHPILLPSYPEGIGPPDHVFVQDFGSPLVVLVWVDPTQPDKVKLSLHMVASDAFIFGKLEPKVIAQTTVRGQSAVWAVGPYFLMKRGGDVDQMRFITGQVLIWQEGEVTYRLETDESLEEAKKIAESLR
jgi:hypothetical protein